MDQKEEILKETVIEDEKPKETLADKLKSQKKKARKKTIKKTLFYGFLLLFSYALWFLFKPFKASAEYGICRSILELTVPYPQSIYVSELKNKRDGSMVLWYTHTDAFGEYRMEHFTCKFFINEKTGIIELAGVKMRRVTMDPKKLAFLNNAMPYFAANPLILTWPVALSDSIGALKFDFDKFRKINLDDIQK